MQGQQCVVNAVWISWEMGTVAFIKSLLVFMLMSHSDIKGYPKTADAVLAIRHFL